MLDASDYTPERAVEIHTAAATERLVGRTIVEFFYLEPGPYNHRHAPCLLLDDGTALIIQSDDEGNDAGSIKVVDTKLHDHRASMTIPRI